MQVQGKVIRVNEEDKSVLIQALDLLVEFDVETEELDWLTRKAQAMRDCMISEYRTETGQDWVRLI